MRTLIRKMITSRGYMIRRSDEDPGGPVVRRDNFHNLAAAYEQFLNAAAPNHPILPNERRSQLLGRTLGTPPTEAYFIIQGLAKTQNIDGAVCEFGVAQGETSALIANEIADGGKKLHLFDSFEGLPRPSVKDRLKDDIFSLGSMEAYTGTMACPENMVRRRLAAINFPAARTVIHKGFVDHVFKTGTNLPSLVSFAYVDFDFYEPIKQALDYLHAHSTRGAVFVVDDYDWFSTGAKTAVDEFVAAHDGSYSLVVPDKSLGCFAVLERTTQK